MNRKQVEVIAPTGLICPRETHGMITDSAPVTVPLTRYYKRMLAEGSLLRYVAPAKKTVKEK